MYQLLPKVTIIPLADLPGSPSSYFYLVHVRTLCQVLWIPVSLFCTSMWAHTPLITLYLWTTLWEHNTQRPDMWQLKVHCPGFLRYCSPCHQWIAVPEGGLMCTWHKTAHMPVHSSLWLDTPVAARTSSTARRSLSLAGGVAEETKLMPGESPEWPVMSSYMSGGGSRWAGQTSVAQLEVRADIIHLYRGFLTLDHELYHLSMQPPTTYVTTQAHAH